jgi:hypothetical protein
MRHFYFRFRSILVGLLFVVGLLFSFRSWMDARFANRVAESLPPVPTQRKPLTKRVVLLLLDDTGYVAAQRSLTQIFGLARERGWVTKVTLDRYTFTIAGVYTLGTGDQPSLLQIKDEFAGQSVTVDSIFASVQRTGGRTTVLGESLWKDLFGRHADAAFVARDLGPFVKNKTEPMLAHLADSLATGESRLTVLHIAETGQLNHRFGINGAPIVELLRELDGKLATLAKQYSNDTTWLIGGDHGTTVEGQHGGESTAERTTFLAAFGPGIAHRELSGLSQVDVSNLVAVLTGAQLPTQGCGLVPDVFAPGTESVVAQAQAELLPQKQALYRGLSERYGQQPDVDESRVTDLKHAIDRIKLGAGGFRDVMGPLAVSLAILILYAVLGFRRRIALTSTVLWFVLGFVIPATFFLFYPSQVYLKMSATVRYLFLGPFFVSIGLAYLVSPFLLPRLAPAQQLRLRVLLWGLTSGLLVSTEMRYYLTFAPLGLVILTGLGPATTAPNPRAILRAYAGCIGTGLAIGALPYAYLCDVQLPLLNTLRLAFRKNDLVTEALLLVVLSGAAAFVNRYYGGRLGRLHRGLGWIAIALAHLGYHLRLTPTNLSLFALLASGILVIAVGFFRDDKQARPYWLLLFALLISTQQQVALHLTLCVLGAFFVRWLMTKNPYPATELRHAGYLAVLSLGYTFTFLATKGHLIRPSHFEQLTAFVGYGMPLYLPLGVALVCFYYLQPLLIAWLFAHATLPNPPSFAPAGRLLVLFGVGQVLFSAVLLSVSTCPGDTYQKSLAGALFTLNIALGSILTLACFGSTAGKTGGTTEMRPV